MSKQFVVLDESKGVVEAQPDYQSAMDAAITLARRDGDQAVASDVVSDSYHENPAHPASSMSMDLLPSQLRGYEDFDVDSINSRDAHAELVQAGYLSDWIYKTKKVKMTKAELRAAKAAGSKYTSYSIVLCPHCGQGRQAGSAELKQSDVKSDPHRKCRSCGKLLLFFRTMTYQDVVNPGGWIMKENAKLEKQAGSRGEPWATSLGLSLVASAFGWTLRDSNKNSILQLPQGNAILVGPEGRTATSYPVPADKPERFNLCPSATIQCMRSCLLMSGQNDYDKNYPKLRATYALLSHTPAFLRLLVDAIDRWHAFEGKVGASRSMNKFTRLNVLSDIPWELAFPWLFQRYEGRKSPTGRWPAFYDYTKVGERIGFQPSNYDLTFSFAGTEDNGQFALNVLHEKAARVAVVFVVGRNQWKPLMKTKRSFMGYPVVDGDRHDVRPYDPVGVWTALRWKPPKRFWKSDEEAKKYRGKTEEAVRPFTQFVTPGDEAWHYANPGRAMPRAKKTVVEADLVDGMWITSEQPRQHGEE